MIAFLIAAALLVVVTLLALIRPWRKAVPVDAAGTEQQVVARIYRDQLAELERDRANGAIDEIRYAEARAEIERRVVDEAAGAPAVIAASTKRTPTWVGLAVVVPVAAIGLYLALGNPAALDESARREPTAEDLERTVDQLAERLARNPDDPKGWAMLARSYRMLQRHEDAARAFERVGTALDNDADLLAAYADVLSTLAKGDMSGRPAQLAQRALQIDPEQPMALSIAAMDAMQRRDGAGAVSYWERLLRVMPPDSDESRFVAGILAKLREAIGPQAGATPPAQEAGPRPAQAGAGITGRVTLAPALAPLVGAADTLFIYARAAQGSRMPLAIVRGTAGALPLAFRLDDSNAMNPASPLSAAGQVVVEARISKGGNAMPAKGDLFGVSAPVAAAVEGVEIVIDRVRTE